MNFEKRMDFLCFGGEDWWYHNRGHIDMQLMRRFSTLGTTLYVNSIIMHRPQVKAGKTFLRKVIRKAKSIVTGLKETDVGFWVYSPFTMPVHHIDWARTLNHKVLKWQLQVVLRRLKMRNPIIWVACPSACQVAQDLKHCRLVYQRTDRYEDDPHVHRETIAAYDRQLRDIADMTVYVNRSLFEQEKGDCRRAVFLDHGVDYEMFAQAENDKLVPQDIQDVKKPIVGYFGGLADHKIDIDLLEKVIEARKDLTFVFVGDAPRQYHASLMHQNVRFLGKKDYKQIPHYGKYFDIAIFPWAINKWTEAANPIKLKEYLALGKPVVSTHFPEIDHYADVVYVSDNAQQFMRNIDKACLENNERRVQQRRRKVAASSWDSKAQHLLEELEM